MANPLAPHHTPTFAPTWRKAADLVAAGLLPPAAQAAIDTLAAHFAIAVPAHLQTLIGDAQDPLGRQFIPDAREAQTAPHEHPDPIGDEAFSPLKGIVHRYPDRALLKPLLACPVYCRFCFRREQVGPDGGVLSEAELDAACAWLAQRPQITEIIITGGEPLLLAPRRLADLLARLDAIGHVQMLRIHTRMPIAAPERITNTLADALATAKPLWLVVHANHARELSPEAVAALNRLRAQGIPLLGQSVLLRGVNDNAPALAALFGALLAARVKPYYLHQLDPAPGTAHFHVPIAEGRALLAALRGRISGMAWPTYVLDIPGGHGKVPVGPDYLEPGGLEPGGQVRDPWGNLRPVGHAG